jgi:hypothetical protein
LTHDTSEAQSCAGEEERIHTDGGSMLYVGRKDVSVLVRVDTDKAWIFEVVVGSVFGFTTE